MRNLYRIATLCVLFLVFGLPYVYQNTDRIIKDCAEDGDFAANALRIEEAKQNNQLLGPYSRFRFHHPGPLIFYIHAAFEKVLSRHGLSAYSAHNLSQMTINFLSVFFMAFILVFHSRSPLTPMFFFILIWTFIYKIDASIWFNTWGPYAVMCSVGLFFLSCAALARGRSRSLIAVALSGSLALQTHISTVAVIPPVFILSFILYARRVPQKRWIYMLWFSAVSLLILWLPPLLELVTTEKNNLYWLLQASKTHAKWQSFHAALQYLMSFYVPSAVENKLLWFGGVFAFLWCIPFSGFKFFFHLRTLLTFGIATSFLYILRTPGELHPYLYYYHYIIAALLYGLFFVPPLEHVFSHRVFFYPVYILSCVFVVGFTWSFYRATFNPQCGQIPIELTDRIQPKASVLYQLEIDVSEDTKAWARAAGIALELRRRDMLFCVPGRWGFLFGRNNICSRVKKNSSEKIQSVQKVIITADQLKKEGSHPETDPGSPQLTE